MPSTVNTIMLNLSVHPRGYMLACGYNCMQMCFRVSIPAATLYDIYSETYI